MKAALEQRKFSINERSYQNREKTMEDATGRNTQVWFQTKEETSGDTVKRSKD